MLFERIPNARDLGNLPAGKGRRVVPGRLFRSGTLHQMTESDRTRLRALGIGTVVDLRSDVERDHDSYHLPGVRLIAAPLVEDWMVRRLMDRFTAGRLDADEIDEWWRQDNATAPDRHVASFRAIFGALLDTGPGEAVLIHCRGGKDRTGVVAALLLEALGVPREHVYADFLLSNVTLRSRERAVEIAADINRALGTSLTPEDVLVFAGVRREWLDAVFAHVEHHHGSVRSYLVGAVGLTPNDLRKLRRRYTGDVGG